MQDEINEKTIALYIKTGKLTAQTLQKAMKTLLAQMKKQKDKMILSILVDTFISKISLTMQPGPKIDSISGA